MMLPDRFVALSMDLPGGRPDLAVSLGAVLVVDEEIVGRWSWLLKPDQIPHESHLRELDLDWPLLSRQLPFREVWPLLWKEAFRESGAQAIVGIDDAEQVSVVQGCKRCRLSPPSLPWLDVMHWARWAYPDHGQDAVKHVVARYEIPWAIDDGPQERAEQIALAAMCLCPDSMPPHEWLVPYSLPGKTAQAARPAPPAAQAASAPRVAPQRGEPVEGASIPPPSAPAVTSEGAFPRPPLPLRSPPVGSDERRTVYQHVALLEEEIADLRARLGEGAPRPVGPEEIRGATEAGRRHRETRGPLAETAFLEAVRWEQAARYFWLGWFEANDKMARR